MYGPSKAAVLLILYHLVRFSHNVTGPHLYIISHLEATRSVPAMASIGQKLHLSYKF